MHDTIAVIFDFDDTLAPDSTSGYLGQVGIDVPKFWKEEVQPLLDDNWDPIPAYFFKMIEKSRSGEIQPITRDGLSNWGKELPYYDGAETIFDRLRNAITEANPKASIEFYLITSGIGEVIRNCSLANQFNEIWASEFCYDAEGRIRFPKRVISFTDKTRYVFQVQKGLYGQESRGKPFDVNRKFDDKHLRVPLNQIVFVGDGYTDIPCFSLIRKAGGIAIGVYDQDNRGKWGRAWGFIEDGRVSNLVPADYSEKSALSNSLIMATESLAKKIALVTKSYQG